VAGRRVEDSSAFLDSLSARCQLSNSVHDCRVHQQIRTSFRGHRARLLLKRQLKNSATSSFQIPLHRLRRRSKSFRRPATAQLDVSECARPAGSGAAPFREQLSFGRGCVQLVPESAVALVEFSITPTGPRGGARPAPLIVARSPASSSTDGRARAIERGASSCRVPSQY